MSEQTPIPHLTDEQIDLPYSFEESHDNTEELVRIESKPIDQLERISPASTMGNEFWGRRKLRPNSEGSTFNNIPLLQFGVDFVDDNAVLKVPSSRYLNEVARKHNQGGFTFVDVEGTETANDFLDMLKRKVFPLAKDLTLNNPETHDPWLNFLDPDFDDEKVAYYGPKDKFYEVTRMGLGRRQMSTYEHDLVDHAGIIALPAGEADKLAEFARIIRDIPDGFEDNELKDVSVSALDLLLEDISAYAIAPANPDSDTVKAYKDHLWGEITHKIESLERVIRIRTDNAIEPKLDLDREAYDQKIKDLQKIESTDGDDTAYKEVGSTALSSLAA